MTQGVAIGTTPVDVVASLSLSVGQWYDLQYQGAGYARVREAATGSAPTASDAATTLYSSSPEPFQVRPESGMGIWVWSSSPAGGRVVIVESD